MMGWGLPSLAEERRDLGVDNRWSRHLHTMPVVIRTGFPFRDKAVVKAGRTARGLAASVPNAALLGPLNARRRTSEC